MSQKCKTIRIFLQRRLQRSNCGGRTAPLPRAAVWILCSHLISDRFAAPSVMPYPKGIKTPEVLNEWLAERREKLRRFDQLVHEGIPRYKAAQVVGVHASSIEGMRRSVEQLEGGGEVIGRAGNSYIDLGLSLLACLRKPGETLTSHDIAAWCGCSRAAIQAIEERALRKVRTRLVATATDQELADELRGMLARC